MDKDSFKTWQIIQFFSLSKAEQGALIGRTEKHWFIEEDAGNPGANYLIGICAACSEFRISRHFDHECIRDFRRAAAVVKDHYDPAYWNFDTLSASMEWSSLREAAQRCMSELSPTLIALKKPFIIEDLIRVEHYTHASEIRRMLEKG